MEHIDSTALKRMRDDIARREQEQAPADDGPPCEVCHDLGMVSPGYPVNHPDFGKLVRCPNPNCRVANANRARAHSNRIRTSRIPETFRKFTFETWELNLSEAEKEHKWMAYYACQLFVTAPNHDFPLSDVKEYLHIPAAEHDYGRHNWIMLQGPLGVGKTGLAISAVNALLENGENALYIRARDMLGEVQGTYGGEGRMNTADMIESFKTAPILFIDEMNIRNQKPDRLEIMETVIRSRYADRLPMFMTANFDRKEFEEHWGDYTADVIFDASHWIYVGGAKLRKTARTAREG